MKISAQEKYGCGPSLSTKHDRMAKAAIIVMFASVLGLIAGLAWA